MSYRELFKWRGRDEAEVTVRAYFVKPEVMADADRIVMHDRWAQETLNAAQKLIEDLTEYRLDLAARYAQLDIMPYKRVLRLDRDAYRYDGIKYHVRIVKVREDKSETDELSETFPGKERHKAIKRFEELKKQNPGIETVKNIEKGKWEH